MSSHNVTGKISDLKKMSDEKKSASNKQPRCGSPQRIGSASNLERPATRGEIFSLETELEEKVRLVLDSAQFQRSSDLFGVEFSYQPHKESMLTTREQMLDELHATPADLVDEPWLDSFIKCECLKVVCDEISAKFSDVLGVTSTEMGNVARKLRLTNRQSFEQMASSWKILRSTLKESETSVRTLTAKVTALESALVRKEDEVVRRFDNEIARMNHDFEQEKAADQEKLLAAEFKMDQMSDTLKYLNGIFRTMQNDGSSLKTTDLMTQCSRLEKENKELKQINSEFDIVRAQLAQANTKIRNLEGQIRTQEDEMSKLNMQLQRREEVIASLMEREALRNAEMEKLQKMSKMKDDELLSMDMKDPATSVLCIRCKKSLDDLTNIKAALLGDGASGPNAPGSQQRLQCEAFRILLPNLRNRKPNRTNAWLRSSMRCILLSKMREHIAWHGLKPDVIRFPAFVYAWYHRSTETVSGAALTRQLILNDEDRWGLYYGVKSLSKDDPESQLFWALLDEAYGQDGLHYTLHCLGVALSLGGPRLWSQFGRAMSEGTSIDDKPDDKDVRQTIWLELVAAKEAVSLILTRALSVHVNAALEAVEALKVTPQDLDQLVLNSKDEQDNAHEEGKRAQEVTQRRAALLNEATHINLFTFLRILQQQLHADKIHRGAAIRLMFETASVGALTPSLPYDPLSGGKGSNSSVTAGHSNMHVEYPQFHSICQTLFPRISVVESAGFYAVCHAHGNRRVFADLFTSEADRLGLFSRSLLLPSMPLLKHLSAAEAAEALNEEIPLATEHEMMMKEKNEQAPSYSIMPIHDHASAGNAAGASITQILFARSTKLVVRSRLATIVHRKIAAMLPTIKLIMHRLPEAWRAIIHDAVHNVHMALDDTYEKLKVMQAEEKQRQANAAKQAAAAHAPLNRMSSGAMLNQLFTATATTETQATGDTHNTQFLDGIQPYLCYRRLLSLLSMAVSINENPLLPAELFTAKALSGQLEITATDSVYRAVRRAETVLSALEESLLVPMESSGRAMEKRSTNKFRRYDHVRRILVARRLQLVVRNFLRRDVAVPRSVRMLLAAGYLSDHRRDGHQHHVNYNNQLVSTATAASKGKALGLKHREVYMDPAWGHGMVASIYLFKLDHDNKAARLGMGPLSLAESVPAFFYHMLGATVPAERAVHDLFMCIRSYRLGSSRLRLFSLFLGDSRDTAIEENISTVLTTPQAHAVYIHLLLSIHAEYSRRQAAIVPVSGTPSRASGGNIPVANAGSWIVDVLFPATENPFQRQDRRETWLLDVDLLVAVARRWALRQPWLKGHYTMYADLPEKLRADPQNRVDVDDFLYIAVIQWARLQAWQLQRSEARGKTIDRTLFSAAGAGPAVGNAAATIADYNLSSGQAKTTGVVSADEQQVVMVNVPSKDVQRGAISRRLSLLPLSNLKSLVDSVYRPGEGENLSDSMHYAVAYIRCIRSRRLHVPPHKLTEGGDDDEDSTSGPSQALVATSPSNSAMRRRLGRLDNRLSSELQDLLRETVLWDTNLHVFLSAGRLRTQTHSAAAAAAMVPTVAAALNSGRPGSSSGRPGSSSGRPSSSQSERNAGGGASRPVSRGGEAITGKPVDESIFVFDAVIEEACAPELQYAAAKQLFLAYQTPFNSFLNMVAEEMKEDPAAAPAHHHTSNQSESGNLAAEVRQRIHGIRFQLLSLTEFFSQPDAVAASYKLCALRQMGAAAEDLQELVMQRHAIVQVAREAQQMVKQMVSGVAELSVLTQHEFPRDAWHSGAKVHLDKAFVYSIHTKAMLT